MSRPAHAAGNIVREESRPETRDRPALASLPTYDSQGSEVASDPRSCRELVGESFPGNRGPVDSHQPGDAFPANVNAELLTASPFKPPNAAELARDRSSRAPDFPLRSSQTAGSRG
ncbi:hypothetical protein GCM10009724_23310 [Microbacterium lacticum]|nr:hypothetical protein MLA01_23030 [Microbacterium lacticum]GGI71751.1 hypothetical protein GCM10009724_23310 [Microbacterium lacticum]